MSFARMMMLVAATAALAGCYVEGPGPGPGPRPEGPVVGRVWVPGHYGPGGGWIPGHYR